MCAHTFAWHGVIPPSHCPQCGACLGCGQVARPPVRPLPVTPWTPGTGLPWPRPYYGTTTNVATL